MKYLKIENNKCYYRISDGEWQEVDKINKEDLMTMLDKAIESNFEMDDYDIDKIANRAHQIIYKNLHSKLSELLENRNRFKDESEQLYKSAIAMYNKTE